jgi:hypothetical protein
VHVASLFVATGGGCEKGSSTKLQNDFHFRKNYISLASIPARAPVFPLPWS